MTTIAVNSAVPKPKQAEPVTLQRRIGSTTYQVAVHFNVNSKETMEDKVLRLLQSEVTKVA